MSVTAANYRINELSRFRILVGGIAASVCISTFYGFNLLSNHMQTKYLFTSAEVTAITTTGIVVGFVTFLGGMLLDYAGPLYVCAIATTLNTLGALLFGLTFNDVIECTVVKFAVFCAIMNWGCALFDTGSLMAILGSFPLTKGPVVAIMKTFAGLGASILAVINYSFFRTQYAGYMYFMTGIVLVLGSTAATFIRFPPYHILDCEKHRVPREQKLLRRLTEKAYLTQRPPMIRFYSGLTIVLTLLVYLTTQSLCVAYAPKMTDHERLGITIGAIVLVLCFALTAAPFPFLGGMEKPYSKHYPELPENMSHSKVSPNEPSYSMTRASNEVSNSVNNYINNKQKDISYLDDADTNEMMNFQDGNNEEPIYRNDEERAVLQPMPIEIQRDRTSLAFLQSTQVNENELNDEMALFSHASKTTTTTTTIKSRDIANKESYAAMQGKNQPNSNSSSDERVKERKGTEPHHYTNDASCCAHSNSMDVVNKTNNNNVGGDINAMDDNALIENVLNDGESLICISDLDPQYQGSFWSHLKTLDLWLCCWNTLATWGCGLAITFNSANIYRALNMNVYDERTNTLYSAIIGVGSALGRMSMGVFEGILLRYPSTQRPVITTVYPLSSSCMVIGLVFLILLPEGSKAILIGFFFDAFGNGFSWASTALTIRTIYASDIGKHYNFMFVGVFIAVIALNRFAYGEMYDIQAKKQRDSHMHEKNIYPFCSGKVCVRNSFIVLMCVNATAIVGSTLCHIRYRRFVMRYRKSMAANASHVTAETDNRPHYANEDEEHRCHTRNEPTEARKRNDVTTAVVDVM